MGAGPGFERLDLKSMTIGHRLRADKGVGSGGLAPRQILHQQVFHRRMTDVGLEQIDR